MSKSKRNEETNERPAFEESMSRLEKIVSQLEQGELSLEDSLRLFEEGISLTRGLDARLTEAEMKVEQLVQAADGQIEVAPLELPEGEA